MKKVVFVSFCLFGSAVWAADGTVHRTWTATEGYWNVASSWADNTPPADSSGGQKGETSYFTGSPASGDDFRVLFPMGGLTESTYTLFVDLANGKSVTFDTTGTTWTKGAGTYPSDWQVFTLGTHSTGGVSYPHLLQSSLSSKATTTHAVMSLSDGVVKVVRDDASGSSVELLGGTWNFYDPDGAANGNTLTLLGTAGMANGKVILRGGSFKAGAVGVLGKSAGSVFLIEGGEHETRALSLANDAAAVNPLMKMTGGKLTLPSGNLNVAANQGKSASLVLENDAVLDVANDSLIVGGGNGATGMVQVCGGATVSVGKGTLKLTGDANAKGELTVTNSATVTAVTASVGAGGAGAEGVLTVAGEGALTVTGNMTLGGNQSTGKLAFRGHSTGSLKNVYGGDASGNNAAASTVEMTFADDSDVTFSGYFLPVNSRIANDVAPTAVVRVQDRARLVGTATSDAGSGETSGGFNFAHNGGIGRLEISGDGSVSTAARLTLSHAAARGELVMTDRARLVATNASGIIIGRGQKGSGSIEIHDNASLETTTLAFGGNYAYGDNTPGELRMTMDGGSVYGSSDFSVNGTNTVIRLGGGSTSFATWAIAGEPKVDPDGELVTNTLTIAGGVHTVRGYNKNNASIAIGRTNCCTLVELTGGELNANSLIMVGMAGSASGFDRLAVSGGKLTLAPRGGAADGDSKILCSLSGGCASEFDFTGGEVVANSIRGGSGTTTFYANGGLFTVLGAVAGDWALSRFTTAKLGERGLMVNVKPGLTAVANQKFVDAEAEADGLFAKTGAGTLVVSNACEGSAHAITRVTAGKLAFDKTVKTFGRQLEIESGAFVLVQVPAEAGAYEVLKLERELDEAELKRILPQVWGDGLSYVASQTTGTDGVTVTMTVAASGASGREVGVTTTYADAQVLASTFRVTAENVSVTFAAPVEIVGGELVIDVPRGSVVTFEEPVSSAYTAVRKIGAGQVAFAKANPGFYGTWTQAGGTFDVRSAAFSDNADGIAITTDTLKFSGESAVTVAPQLKVQGASPQKRVVVGAESDVTFAGGWNSTNGGLVKHGPGTLEIVEPSGTFALGTSSVAASDGAVSQLPADGASPADASVKQNNVTAGAALQILDGKVVVKGAGQTKTTVNNTQSIFVSTGYSGQRAEAGLEICDCTYNADGTTRSFNVGHSAGVADCSHPTLTVKNAKLVSHRMLLAGNAGTSKDIYPTATFENATVQFESGFQLGAASDKCHPSLKLVNTQVTQYRAGYAIGHSFCRDVQVEILSNSLLNATYTSNAGNNWKGIQFEQNAWGTIRVASGSKLQTSWFNILNTNATTEKHVDLVFDGGVLEMTSDGVAAHEATTFAKPECQGFTSEGDGMEVQLGDGVVHTFATPFRGAGDVTKTGAGTMALAAVADGNGVFRQTGATVVAEGVLDLGGTAQTFAALGGAGTVRNGTVKGALLATVGASADAVPTFENVTFANVKVAVAGDGAEVGTRIPLAKASAVPAGLLGKTTDKAHTVAYSVEDGVLYATLGPKSGMMVIVR